MGKETEMNSNPPAGIQTVDLGLPSGLLWADRNLGAASPEDSGAFYSWGNTEPHYPHPGQWGEDAFDYDFCEEIYDDTPGAELRDDIDADHDAATVSLGHPWRMPTRKDFKELCDNCTYKRVIRNNMAGLLFTSNINGATLFLPCSGYGSDSSWDSRGASGYYWSSSLYSARGARYLLFISGGVRPQNTNYCYYGFAVRAVCLTK